MKNLNIFVLAVAATLCGCDCQKKSCSAHEISKEAKVYHYFGSIADTLEIEKVHPAVFTNTVTGGNDAVLTDWKQMGG
jgi:hypothetical protein